MIKGDKIKLVKKMGMFDNIGEICEVINVDENGVISFGFGINGIHLGCMSYNEFEKYFELVQETKREWSSWKTERLFYENLNGDHISTTIYYRHNGKKIRVKGLCEDGTFVSAESSCHSEDKFNLDRGLKLAEYRLVVKLLQKEVEDFAKTM